MRDRRTNFTKDYIASIVNPLAGRPDPYGARAASGAAAVGRSAAAAAATSSVAAASTAAVVAAAAAAAQAITSSCELVGQPTVVATAAPVITTAASSAAATTAAAAMLMQNAVPAANGEADALVGGLNLLPAGLNGSAAAAAAAAAAVGAAGVQNRDTTWTKLFVGGLPYHTTDRSLREHFAVYGDIEEAVVITDRANGKSRGYGFVIMGDRASAERACREPNPIIDGRKANVNLAILGAKPRGNVPTGTGFSFPGVRAGYPTLLPSQYGMPSYMYQSPYLATTAPGSIVPLAPTTQLSHAAAMAAATTQFYEYQNAAAMAAAAAAPYTGQYPSGFDAYAPYAAAANAAGAAAGYMPYTYAAALPQTTSLPAAAAAAAAGSFQTLPYQTAAAQGPTMQEAS